MIALIWRYEVRDEHLAEFEAAYGPTGDWARLFARSEGFRGTELMRADDGSYLTLDIWVSAEAFEAFLAEHGADYNGLDARTEAWTRCEHRMGAYEVLD